ncbi:MAG: TetR/AcrR family transcriptional regulator [Phenylobacterium sp.]|uniref:TetR/AcrR family transcriptional regulator n=1 Tax=Phenylobacterium sp. TaxID=1871053 RepID=UPI0027347BCE|nr:TetR/AcrR family transcriptional regulator [Phenylobacterium sp.]MDP3173486.1 TetR/AcrR family transcriptional regulator [Phenylobacterium sp.]MDP3522147.1 TetR/AcrR family transcriptional regulator [Hydrogenophaga sp.]
MARERVRISVSPATPRRRPQQSRARASSEALQEAFVRVLLERGFDAMTVREVASVAGVGIGTFYDYVSDKQALAALTIHMRVRAMGQGLLARAESLRGQPLGQLVPALVEHQIEVTRQEARVWAALYQLERQISTPEAYRKNYRRFVEVWTQALALAADAPDAITLARTVRAVHVMTYGWVVQALLVQGTRVDWHLLTIELLRAVQGYLAPPSGNG